MKDALTNIFTLKNFNRFFAFENLVPVIVLSFVAWYISYANGLATSYNDAMAHVNLSRMVIDNQEPGIAQIGTVWLPLNHILPLLFVWNEWAWRSGFAGSVFSMIAYVISVWAIYKTVFLVTKNKLAALVGGLAFALNLNILYIQTTPLTESLYIGLFSLSMLVFTLFLTHKNNTKYLLLLGVLGFLQVITRYDGWFVVVVQGLLILLHEFGYMKKTIQETVGKLFLYGLPVILGVGMWFLWNALIFGHPLYFMYGEYSAHAQQTVIEQNAGLVNKGNILQSSMTYMYTMIHNIGEFILAYSIFGLAVLFLLVKQSLDLKKKLLFVSALISPIIFNILALFLGFSTINIPELQANVETNPSAQWFNVRYGLLALPFAAILLGIFASWRKVAAALAMTVIIFQGYVMYTNGLITVVDGTVGLSAYKNHNVSTELQLLVNSEDTVLMSMASFSSVAFESDIQLKQIVHEGVSKQWNLALRNPEQYAHWIVLGGEGVSGDSVRNALIVDQENAFLKNYALVYANNEARIYKLKNTNTLTYRGGAK